MRNYTRNMHQQATYWPKGAPDGFGGYAYPSPESIRVRWEDKAEIFRDADGSEVTSSAVVYVPRPLQIDGYIVLGTFTGSPIDAGARQIQQTGTTPSLGGNRQLSKVWL